MTSWERRWDSCAWHWGQVWSQTTGNPPPPSPHPRPPHPHSRASWQARRGGGDSCAQHWGWGGRLNGPRGRLTSAWSPETTSCVKPISLIFSFFYQGSPGCPAVGRIAALPQRRSVLRKIQFQIRKRKTLSKAQYLTCQIKLTWKDLLVRKGKKAKGHLVGKWKWNQHEKFTW